MPSYARFTTRDPLCEKYYSISPYAYCAGNPVNLVDPEGLDVWEVNQQGGITKEEESDDNVLFSLDSDGNRQQSLSINNGDILDKLSQNNNDLSSFSSKTDEADLKSLFIFLSDNTSVEWALHKAEDSYTLGTVHNRDSAGNWKMLGVPKRPDESYHSHPGINPDKGSEVFSMSADYYNLKNAPQSKANNYYIYFPNSGNVYSLSPDYYRVINRTINKLLGIK